MRTTTSSFPAADDLDAHRLVLRDGSSASVRVSNPADRGAIRRFFHDLSPESRRTRFLGTGEPSDAIVDRFCDSSDLSRALTLVATRQIGGEERIVAVASYVAVTDTSAEAAFAVDDRFHGKGLGTLLLERLAAQAAAKGFRRFEATMLAENTAMREVFRDSGFEIRSRSAAGTIEMQLSLAMSADGVVASEERGRLATAASLRPMLEPRAVAIVGASRDRTKIGSRILAALVRAGFAGPLYPVHPSAAELNGLPAFRSFREVPSGVDLAVIAVPAPSVSAVVDDCAAAGVKSIVVITAGFAEAGKDGRELQDRLVAQVRGYGMRMVGPNCMGLLNMDPAVRLNASFSPLVPPPGRVAMSSQSGALGLSVLALAAECRLGLSAFVSVGNKADVSSNDLLEYWEKDPRTGVILLYLESFGNPRRFARLARRVGRSKPIVAVKAGRTRAGSRAAHSHTAALAASDAAVEALFHQSGVIRADTIDEMFDIAACLDAQPLPRGRRVAIVTNAGGPGIMAVDACEAAGLIVSEFSVQTCARLGAFLPPTATIGNPVDMVASAGPHEYRQAVEVAATAPETDALVVIFTPVDASRSDDILEGIAEGIAGARAAGAHDKPILACLMAEARRPASLQAGAETIPTYSFPENASRALAKIAAYESWRSQPAGLFWSFDDIRVEDARATCRQAIAERGAGWLTTEETRDVLNAFGVPCTATMLARTADEAAAQAAVFGFPVAAKLASRQVPHKSDVGGVRLNLSTAQEVRQAFQDIMTRSGESVAAEGVLVQPMIPGGIETIVGVAHDPLFGSLVGFGIGGTEVEIFGDVRFRVAPLTDRDADELLHEIRGRRLLEGFRGRPPADLDALRDIVLRVSRLAETLPEIAELDLNPVIALSPGKGCRVVDARMRVSA